MIITPLLPMIQSATLSTASLRLTRPVRLSSTSSERRDELSSRAAS